jgi:hypothetical protein
VGRPSAQYQVFDNNWIIGGCDYPVRVEFLADKIPWLDSAVGTRLHTPSGPLVAHSSRFATIGDVSPATQTLVGLLGGALATGTHLSKERHRAVANASRAVSPTGFSASVKTVRRRSRDACASSTRLPPRSWWLSACVLMVAFATWIIRAIKRRFAHAL